MPNTYTQIYLQFVFAVKYRACVIQPSWKNNLYQYITGIVQNNGHKMLVINGMPDHLHIFIGMMPNQSISDLLKDVKRSSSIWINENKFVKGKFEWQEGYGAFSYAKSQIKNVIAYIENQEEHHKSESFKKEYIQFLQKFEIAYDEKYIFKDLI